MDTAAVDAEAPPVPLTHTQDDASALPPPSSPAAAAAAGSTPCGWCSMILPADAYAGSADGGPSAWRRHVDSGECAREVARRWPEEAQGGGRKKKRRRHSRRSSTGSSGSESDSSSSGSSSSSDDDSHSDGRSVSGASMSGGSKRQRCASPPQQLSAAEGNLATRVSSAMASLPTLLPLFSQPSERVGAASLFSAPSAPHPTPAAANPVSTHSPTMPLSSPAFPPPSDVVASDAQAVGLHEGAEEAETGDAFSEVDECTQEGGEEQQAALTHRSGGGAQDATGMAQKVEPIDFANTRVSASTNGRVGDAGALANVPTTGASDTVLVGISHAAIESHSPHADPTLPPSTANSFKRTSTYPSARPSDDPTRHSSAPATRVVLVPRPTAVPGVPAATDTPSLAPPIDSVELGQRQQPRESASSVGREEAVMHMHGDKEECTEAQAESGVQAKAPIGPERQGAVAPRTSRALSVTAKQELLVDFTPAPGISHARSEAPPRGVSESAADAPVTQRPSSRGAPSSDTPAMPPGAALLASATAVPPPLLPALMPSALPTDADASGPDAAVPGPAAVDDGGPAGDAFSEGEQDAKEEHKQEEDMTAEGEISTLAAAALPAARTRHRWSATLSPLAVPYMVSSGRLMCALCRRPIKRDRTSSHMYSRHGMPLELSSSQIASSAWMVHMAAARKSHYETWMAEAIHIVHIAQQQTAQAQQGHTPPSKGYPLWSHEGMPLAPTDVIAWSKQTAEEQQQIEQVQAAGLLPLSAAAQMCGLLEQTMLALPLGSLLAGSVGSLLTRMYDPNASLFGGTDTVASALAPTSAPTLHEPLALHEHPGVRSLEAQRGPPADGDASSDANKTEPAMAAPAQAAAAAGGDMPSVAERASSAVAAAVAAAAAAATAAAGASPPPLSSSSLPASHPLSAASLRQSLPKGGVRFGGDALLSSFDTSGWPSFLCDAGAFFRKYGHLEGHYTRFTSSVDVDQGGQVCVRRDHRGFRKSLRHGKEEWRNAAEATGAKRKDRGTSYVWGVEVQGCGGSADDAPAAAAACSSAAAAAAAAAPSAVAASASDPFDIMYDFDALHNELSAWLSSVSLGRLYGPRGLATVSQYLPAEAMAEQPCWKLFVNPASDRRIITPPHADGFARKHAIHMVLPCSHPRAMDLIQTWNRAQLNLHPPPPDSAHMFMCDSDMAMTLRLDPHGGSLNPTVSIPDDWYLAPPTPGSVEVLSPTHLPSDEQGRPRTGTSFALRPGQLVVLAPHQVHTFVKAMDPEASPAAAAASGQPQSGCGSELIGVASDDFLLGINEKEATENLLIYQRYTASLCLPKQNVPRGDFLRSRFFSFHLLLAMMATGRGPLDLLEPDGLDVRRAHYRAALPFIQRAIQSDQEHLMLLSALGGKRKGSKHTVVLDDTDEKDTPILGYHVFHTCADCQVDAFDYLFMFSSRARCPPCAVAHRQAVPNQALPRLRRRFWDSHMKPVDMIEACVATYTRMGIPLQQSQTQGAAQTPAAKP